MKNCNKCGVELVVGGNWLESCAKNYANICRTCNNANSLAWSKANPKAKKDLDAAYRRNNYKKVRARQREWRASNIKAVSAQHASYYADNSEHERARNSGWKKKNPGKVNAINAKRRALLKQQTPSWYCHWMVVEIYEIAAEMGYEVDHIQPLSKGGLHSHENLQLLTREENGPGGKWDSESWMPGKGEVGQNG